MPNNSGAGSIQLTARNADLGTMAALLRDHRARGLDVIVNTTAVTAKGGNLVIDKTGQQITEDGVTECAGAYTPTRAAEALIAGKLGIHGSYLTRMRETARLSLWDTNVNAWLHGSDGQPADPRNFMMRLLRADDGTSGVLRAMLSDTFRRIDNLDVLMSALNGIHESGADVNVTGCDLTDSRMYARVEAPGIQALAPEFLKNYRNPFTGAPDEDLKRWEQIAGREGMGYDGGGAPVMFAGFVISNSEIGQGRFSITPRIVVQICRNGLTIKAEALTEIHRGTRQDEGVIAWSDETQAKELALVTSKVKDAVRTFLSPDYLTGKIAQWEAEAGTPLANPAAVVKEVVKASAFPNDYEDEILAMFTRGGQVTAGGVAQAFTAAAQTVTDAELAALMEDEALPAMQRAARLAAR